MSINMDSLEKLLNEFKDAFYRDDLPLQAKIHNQIQSSSYFHSEWSKFSHIEYEKYIADLEEVDRCLTCIHGID